MAEPVTWPSLPLGDIAQEMCLGKMLDKQKNKGTLQPYLRNVNVRWFEFALDDLKEMRFEADEVDRYAVQPGDLIICEGGEPGRGAVWKSSGSVIKIQKALHRVRFDDGLYDSTFALLYLYFGTLTDRFARLYTGTTIKHLTGKALRRVEFPVPPIVEQRAIAAKVEALFSELDAGVAHLEAARALLTRYRQSVLKAAFEGRLTAEWRAQRRREAEAAGPGAAEALPTARDLLEQIEAERRARAEQQHAEWVRAVEAWEAAGGKDSGTKKPRRPARPKDPPPLTEEELASLPALPEGWCWTLSGGLFVFVTSGSRGWARYYSDTGAVFLRVGNLDHCSISLDLQNIQRVTPPESAETDRTRVCPGDIVISVTADVGMVAVIPESLEEAYINQHIALARPVSSVHLPYLAWYLASEEGGQVQFNALQRGATKLGLGLDDVRAVRVPLPPFEEQVAIADAIEQHMGESASTDGAITSSLAQSTALRQSILKRAFEGRLLDEAELEAVRSNPDYEPADRLLERIREQASAQKQTKKKTATKTTARKKRSARQNTGTPQETT